MDIRESLIFCILLKIARRLGHSYRTTFDELDRDWDQDGVEWVSIDVGYFYLYPLHRFQKSERYEWIPHESMYVIPSRPCMDLFSQI